ncbi:hypothetical protein Glove_310g20 [Diversispora epigaea]|uniref:Uncharacterized protein n=1 Tax=Diversispora epigaea TaxID=1348612 RepID=A0A397HRV9_9GLOM|nr:hypothetical protein Glove_310g20 [Diversispora epigaea]
MDKYDLEYKKDLLQILSLIELPDNPDVLEDKISGGMLGEELRCFTDFDSENNLITISAS